MYLVIKFIITAIIVVAVSELAKRSTIFGALIASLPLTSILALIWLFHDSKDLSEISNLSLGIFWMVIPSLAFFLLLPLFIRLGFSFYASLAISSSGTALIYYLFAILIDHLDLK